VDKLKEQKWNTGEGREEDEGREEKGNKGQWGMKIRAMLR
jgi:hypothetical protein